MKRWALLDRAEIPGGGELRLMQRDTEYSIMLGTTQLMNSRRTGSEEALATFACDRIRDRRRPKILIGGLGMGFTLRAALAVLATDASVTVAELVPAVVEWARGPMAGIFEKSLEDPRVLIHEGDVGALIAASVSAYDAILLDVDNGPEGLVRKANDRIYDMQGLRAARRALRPDGILAVWSSWPNKPFTDRLKAAGFDAKEVQIRAKAPRGGALSIVWIATSAEAAEGMRV